MAREIRVSVDDDEVFERMRARKRELDLSWEEVLHRGLRDREGGVDDLGDRIERQVTRRVEQSLGSAFGVDVGGPGDRDPTPGYEPDPPGGVDPAGPSTPGDPTAGTAGTAGTGGTAGGLDEEMETLANAEDAVLAFPTLADEPHNTVPLRVTIETGADGMAVDVVAVRTSRAAADRNRFDRGARRAIAEELAGGGTATLSLAAGEEEYPVVPELSWATEDDHPTVTEVEIVEVRFGD